MMEKEKLANRIAILSADSYRVDLGITSVKRRLGADTAGKFETSQFRPGDAPLEKIIETALTSSFFAAGCITIIRDIDDYLESERQTLSTALMSLPAGNYVVLSASKREHLKSFDGFQIIDVDRDGPAPDVARIVRNWSKENDIRLDDDLVQFLVSQYRNDPSVLRMELAKLADFVTEKKSLTLDDLRQLTFDTSEISTFDFTRALRDRDNITALAKLHALRSYVKHPAQIVGAAATQFMFGLRGAAPAADRRPAAYVRAGREGSEIIAGMEKLYQIDRKIKAGTKFAYEHLELFIFDH